MKSGGSARKNGTVLSMSTAASPPRRRVMTAKPGTSESPLKKASGPMR